MRTKTLLLGCLSLAVTAFACSGSEATEEDSEGGEDAITSNEAQIVDFTFESELVASKNEETRKSITTQLFYTIGALTTEHGANGQVGRTEIASTETVEGELKRIKYKAKLPVAWPKGRSVPRRYPVVLPKDVTNLAAFNRTYDGKCGNNEYGQATFWHDFNPKAATCVLNDADVSKSSARVTKNRSTTQGKYPEYKKVWEDGALNVVAIFGYSDSGGPSDAGEWEFNEFVRKAKEVVPGSTSTTNPTSDSIHQDITVKGKVRVQGADRDVSITTLLIGSLYTSGADFDRRYDPLSEKADLVVYNGHSELSKNTNSLARKGKVAPKQYQMFFFDSCDTYAYLDTKLVDRRKEVNGADDPKGTKYLDVATNVLPSYFHNYAASSLSFVKAFTERDTPKTYNEIMAEIAADQIVVVTGEEDNTFRP